MDLHYLTFTGRNIGNKKKLTLARIISVGSNSKNIMNSVIIFNDNYIIIIIINFSE